MPNLVTRLRKDEHNKVERLLAGRMSVARWLGLVAKLWSADGRRPVRRDLRGGRGTGKLVRVLAFGSESVKEWVQARTPHDWTESEYLRTLALEAHALGLVPLETFVVELEPSLIERLMNRAVRLRQKPAELAARILTDQLLCPGPDCGSSPDPERFEIPRDNAIDMRARAGILGVDVQDLMVQAIHEFMDRWKVVHDPFNPGKRVLASADPALVQAAVERDQAAARAEQLKLDDPSQVDPNHGG